MRSICSLHSLVYFNRINSTNSIIIWIFLNQPPSCPDELGDQERFLLRWELGNERHQVFQAVRAGLGFGRGICRRAFRVGQAKFLPAEVKDGTQYVLVPDMRIDVSGGVDVRVPGSLLNGQSNTPLTGTVLLAGSRQ